jgi:hypothetical protein
MVSPSPTTKYSFPPSLIFLAALLCFFCGNTIAQTATADYTSDLPSVERVKAEIKGSDPTDTLARQVAVFTYLQAYVERIKYNRSISGPYTPGRAARHRCTQPGRLPSSLLWDIPTTLHAGDNTITLTAANAEVVR